MKKVENYIYFIFGLLPIFLVSGPFLTDFSVCVLVIFFVWYLIKESNYKFLNNNLFWFFLLFYVYLIISASINYQNLVKYNFFFYLRFILFSFSICFFFIRDEKYIRILVYSLIALFFIIFLDVASNKFYQEGILGVPTYSKYRISSFFYDELILGSFLFRALIILNPLYLYLYKGKKYLFFLMLINFLTILCVLQSGERAALFLMIIYFILNIFILNFDIKKKITIFFSALIILLSSIYFSPQIKNRFLEQTFLKVNFLENHILLFKSAVNIGLDSPIIGSGYRSFQIKCSEEKYYINDSPQCSTHPHNTYIQLFAELGIIGVVFIFLFFSYFCWQYLKFFYLQIKKKLIKQNYLLLTITGIIINFFPFTTTGNFFNNWLSFFYFFPIGLLIFFNQNIKIKNE
tara:strand:+ start:23709 stop:24920 length:1212 start_codon:yes stop_codon:yes gene_type:complete